MVEKLASGFAHIFKPPHPRLSGHPLERSWRLRSPGRKRGGLTHLDELRSSLVGLPRLLSGPGFGQYAFGNSRWALWRYVNGMGDRRLAG